MRFFTLTLLMGLSNLSFSVTRLSQSKTDGRVFSDEIPWTFLYVNNFDIAIYTTYVSRFWKKSVLRRLVTLLMLFPVVVSLIRITDLIIICLEFIFGC
jgi:hypothetical protein